MNKTRCMFNCILMLIIMNQMQPIHAESTMSFDSFADKDKFSSSDLSDLAGKWDGFIDVLYRQTPKSKFIRIPRMVWNRQVENAYISLLEGETKHDPAAFRTILLNPWDGHNIYTGSVFHRRRIESVPEA